MTYRGKLELEHPNWNTEKVNSVVVNHCPGNFYPGAGKPEYCDPCTKACEKCWERVIEKTASRLNPVNNDPKTKRLIKEYEELRKNAR